MAKGQGAKRYEAVTEHTGNPLLLLLALLFVVAALAGCGSTASAHAGTLRLPLYGDARQLDVGILDPAKATSRTPLDLSSLLQAGLVTFGPDMHIIPNLAVSIPTISSGGRTYTFTIRQDARFADGRACTAKDVIYSFTRALWRAGPDSTAPQYLGGIDGAGAVLSGQTRHLVGVEALARLTVRIHLAVPDASFLDKLAFPVAAVVEPGHAAAPSGLGPFYLALLHSDGSFELTPRPHAFGGSVSLRGVTVVAVRSLAAGMDLYHRGLLDVAQVPAAQFSQSATRADFHAGTAPSAYYAIPQREGARLAVALDRDRLIAAVPALAPLSGIVPPTVPDYVASTANLSPDTEGPAPVISLRVKRSDDPVVHALTDALRRQWIVRSGGVAVTVVHDYFALPDPGRWLRAMLPYSGSAWFHRLTLRANVLTNDPVSRMNAYSTIEQWALDHSVVIPLASDQLGFLIKPAVAGLLVTPLGIMPDNNSWSTASLT